MFSRQETLTFKLSKELALGKLSEGKFRLRAPDLKEARSDKEESGYISFYD